METNKEIPYGKCKCGCGQDTPLAKQNNKKKGIIRGGPINYLTGHYHKINVPKILGEPKLCECGCGEPAPIAKYNSKILNWVKGYPKRFISGHNTKVKPRVLFESRFWPKVNISTDDLCWDWHGCKNSDGYGMIRINGTSIGAHRVAFELSGGVLTEEKNCVCHKCDNPPCCNPKHLFAGSVGDNTRDMVSKGRCDNAGSRNGRAKLDEGKVIKIFQMHKTMSHKDIGRLFGISTCNISKIIQRRLWKNVLIPQ